MSQTLLSEIEDFMAETGLSAHRVGILIANNGRLVDRLREGGRVWPDTQASIKSALRRERNRRAANDAQRGRGAA